RVGREALDAQIVGVFRTDEIGQWYPTSLRRIVAISAAYIGSRIQDARLDRAVGKPRHETAAHDHHVFPNVRFGRHGRLRRGGLRAIGSARRIRRAYARRNRACERKLKDKGPSAPIRHLSVHGPAYTSGWAECGQAGSTRNRDHTAETSASDLRHAGRPRFWRRREWSNRAVQRPHRARDQRSHTAEYHGVTNEK